MLSLHSQSLSFGQNLIIAQVSAPVSNPQSPIPNNYPIDILGTFGVVVSAIAVILQRELKRLDRRRELEAKHAEDYVNELKAENEQLEAELKISRNTIMGLRVRLARCEGRELSSGELRSGVGASGVKN